MIIKDKFIERFSKLLIAINKSIESRIDVQFKLDGEWFYMPYTDRENLLGSARQIATFIRLAKPSKAILFSAEQAEVFSNISKIYSSALDFRLPFDNVFIQFTQPISAEYKKRQDNDFDRGVLLAAVVNQSVYTQEEMLRFKDGETKKGAITIEYPTDSDNVYVNTISLLYGDGGTEFVRWASGKEVGFDFSDEVRENAMLHWKNVIIACIGYINCENIYIEKEGDVPEAVNRKREAKGKIRIEPYYVCRIKGVQYDNHATGTGVKHGIRYDVRGHFRRLDSGKTIWVRPHQRGLQNELYIPKAYNVAKDSKPGWKSEREKVD